MKPEVRAALKVTLERLAKYLESARARAAEIADEHDLTQPDDRSACELGALRAFVEHAGADLRCTIDAYLTPRGKRPVGTVHAGNHASRLETR